MRRPATPRKSRGQSLVEVAILLPVLLIMLSGMIEFGFALNQYLNILDAAREGARFGSDGDPTQRSSCTDGEDDDNDRTPDDCPSPGIGITDSYADDTLNCEPSPSGEGTLDYYMQIACEVMRTADPVVLDPARDDIVISIYKVYDDPLNVDDGIIGVLPNYSEDPDLSAHNPTTNTIQGQWRLYGNQASRYDTVRVSNLLDVNAPGAGVLIVEVFYSYDQILALPWITPFVPNPVPLYSFTVIPVPAAEPRPTPTPTPTPTNTNTPTFTPTPTPPPTDTGTPPVTDTPTPTDTPTDTPGPTATVEGCGQPDPAASTVTASTPGIWADGTQGATITVALVDNCGFPLSGQVNPVQLTSSRGALDETPVMLTQTGNQFIFVVKSRNVGQSEYTAVVNPLTNPVPLNQKPIIAFMCINGSGSPVTFTGQDVQFSFLNPQNPPTPLGRTLRTLALNWSDLGGTRRLVNIKLGPTIIWSSVAGAASPLTINVADWTSPNRVINPGVTRNLVLNFTAPVAGGAYNLTQIVWDDGAGGSQCTSAPLSVTR
jgi:hypothetical protein